MDKHMQKLQEQICGSAPEVKGLQGAPSALLISNQHSFFNGSNYKSTVSNHTVVSTTSTVSNSTVMCASQR